MIKDIIKGIIIGVANIIPGVSGGTLAVSMGIYDKIIGSINNLFKNFKQSIKTLLPYGIGMILGIAIFSFVITYLFKNFNIPTNFLFIGLILGGIPIIYNGIKSKKINLLHIVLFLIFGSMVIILGMLNPTSTSGEITMSFIEILKLFIVGIVAAATMVIPGVSGSMMLTLLGYYQPITETIKNLIVSLTSFNIDEIINCIGILLPFGIGVIMGIIVIAKLIEFLLKKCPSYVFASILGLIVASPVVIISKMSILSVEIPTIMISVITLALGMIISINLSKE